MGDCGCICVCMHTGARAVLTDLDMLQPLLRDNVRLNCVACHSHAGLKARHTPVRYGELKWGHATSTRTSNTDTSRDDAAATPCAASSRYRILPSTDTPHAVRVELSGGDAVEEATDVVIGADVLYVDPDVFQALLQTLLVLCPPGSSVIAFLSGARRHTAEADYLSRLREHFHVQVHEGPALRSVIDRLQRRAASSGTQYELHNAASVYVYELRRQA